MTQRGSAPPPPKVTAGMLTEVGLFDDLDDAVVGRLARELSTEHVEVGHTVIAEGQTACDMFVVISGELEVVKEGRAGGEARVALFGPGDWFGEMGVLDVQPRSATVRAVAPTMLLRITASDLDRLLFREDIKSYALFIRNIARELSRRLRVADGIVAQLVTAVTDEYVSRRRH